MKLLVFDPTKGDGTNLRRSIVSSLINSKPFFAHWEEECLRSHLSQFSLRVLGTDISAAWLDDQPLLLIPFLRFVSLDLYAFQDWIRRNNQSQLGEFVDPKTGSKTEIFFFRRGLDFEAFLRRQKKFLQDFLWRSDLNSITETLRVASNQNHYPVTAAFDWSRLSQKIEFERWANWFGCHVGQRLPPPPRAEYNGELHVTYPPSLQKHLPEMKKELEKDHPVLLAPENIHFDFLRESLLQKTTNPEIDFVLFTEDRQRFPGNTRTGDPPWVVLTEQDRVQNLLLDEGMLSAARFSGQIWFRRSQRLMMAIDEFRPKNQLPPVIEFVQSLVARQLQGVTFPIDHRISLQSKADRLEYDRWLSFFRRYSQFHDPLASKPSLR